jgi:hypothetical protein
MEHSYLFLVKVFEWFGPGTAHFAHAYPHVIYSWFVMIFLIVCAAIATKSISMIPTKAQNFFEIVISSMEEFMVDIAGEEGRWFFPIICHAVRLHRGVQPVRPFSGILPTDRQHQHDPLLRRAGLHFHTLHRHQVSRCQIRQTFPGSDLVDESP